VSGLGPNERVAFTDALRPPPGYVLEAGVGTTFSLDFDAFTAVILAFVGADLEDERLDPASVLTAVARLRSRLKVYVNAGGLHPPRAPNRLFALYDRITCRVGFEGSAFHPKVWALKFAPHAKPELKRAEPVYRVLCASRNVTDSGCWELGARFDGRAGKGSELGADVARFCRKLAQTSRAPAAVWKLLSELPSVEFERGRESESALRFHWQWPGVSKLEKHLPTAASRALVISPFLRKSFLDEILDRVGALTIVSTQQELDALPDDAHERLAAATTYVVTGAGTDAVPALDLHAKLLAWEKGDTRETLVGSANATGAAWGLGPVNCEAMLALRPGLRIDDVLRSFVAPRDGELCGWIEEYVRRRPEPDAEEQARKRLDGLQRGLATGQLRGAHDAAGQALLLRGVGAAPAALARLPEGIEVEVVPLLRADDAEAWRSLADAFSEGLRFERVGLADLCAFAIIRLRDLGNHIERCFGIQFDLPLAEEAADARDEALNAKLLENLDPRALLLNVLRGLPAGTGVEHGARSRGGAPPGSFLAHATLERVMEVCTADPSRIEEVEALLGACKTADGMQSFVEFWAAFKVALQGERRV